MPNNLPKLPFKEMATHVRTLIAANDGYNPTDDNVYIYVPDSDGSPVSRACLSGKECAAYDHIKKQYKSAGYGLLSRSNFNNIVRGMLPKHLQSSLPDDLEPVTGTPRVCISRKEHSIYTKQKVNGVDGFVKMYNYLPEVNAVYYNKDAVKGKKKVYDLTICGERELVNSDDFAHSAWTSMFHNLVGIETATTSGVMKQVISHLSDESRTLHIKSMLHTGYNKLDPKMTGGREAYAYVLDHGQILTTEEYANAPVFFESIVETDALTETWMQRQQIGESFDQDTVVTDVNYIEKLTPDSGTASILLANACRSMIATIRNIRMMYGHAVLVFGDNGTCKTGLSVLTSNVGKVGIYPDGVDSTLRNTSTTIELKFNNVHDRPIIVDDAKKGKNDLKTALQQREQNIDNLSRAAFDHKKIKERANPDLTIRKSATVETFPVFTLEYYPVEQAESFFRRTLVLELPKDEVHQDSDVKDDVSATSQTDVKDDVSATSQTAENKPAKETYNIADAAYYHTNGLYQLGYNITRTYLKRLNDEGMNAVANDLFNKHSGYARNIKRLVLEKWSDEKLPGNSTSVINAAANIMIGAGLIDDATDHKTTVADNVQAYLVNTVVTQLSRMSNRLYVNGLSPLDYAIQVFCQKIAEKQRIGSQVYRFARYSKIDLAPEVRVVDSNGITYLIPGSQFGPSDKEDKYSSPVIAGYITDGRKDGDLVYITDAGRDALLSVMHDIDDLVNVDTKNMLTKQLLKEGWLRKPSGKDLTSPCNPDSGKGPQLRCLALFLERLIPIIYNVEERDKTEEYGKTDALKPSNVTDMPVRANQDTASDQKRQYIDESQVGDLPTIESLFA